MKQYLSFIGALYAWLVVCGALGWLCGTLFGAWGLLPAIVLSAGGGHFFVAPRIKRLLW